MFRFVFLFFTVLLVGGSAAQADDTVVKKLKALNGCAGCDLGEADLTEAVLEKANL